MNNEKNFPKRKRLRLKNYDYNKPGAYFITICTHDKKCILSRIVGAIHESPVSCLSDYGKIVDRVINDLPKHSKVTVNSYVIMPNHIHLILSITDDPQLRAIRESPLHGRSVISNAVGFIKMNASKQIRTEYEDGFVWQRGFHDHIIRNKEDYCKIAKYIYDNPKRWQLDCFYSEDICVETQGG